MLGCMIHYVPIIINRPIKNGCSVSGLILYVGRERKMAKSKEYDEFYGKVVFDEDPGTKKLKFSRFGEPGKNKTSDHPGPIDVVVVDNNQNILSEPKSATKTKTKVYNRQASDVDDKPVTHVHENGRISKIKSGKAMVRNDSNSTLSYDFGEARSESSISRSGVHLTFAGDGASLREVQRSSTPVEKYESDGEDLRDFCVDHMTMCRSRRTQRRNRIMNILSSDSPHPSSSYNSTGSSAMSSLRGSGYSESRSSRENSAVPAFYLEDLERLYDYAGTIMEDRQALKEYLIARKAAVMEQYYEFMEDVITYILQLKEAFLVDIAETHKAHARGVSKEATKFHRIRHETRMAIQSLQDAVDPPKSSAQRLSETLTNAVQRAKVFEEILKRSYDAVRHNRYEYVASEELKHAFEISHVAHVNVTIDTPTLPPFLSANSGNSKTDDGSERLEFVACSEGEESVGTTKRCAFSGISYVTKDNLLVADWNNGFVKLFNKHGVLEDKFKFEQSPWDVVQMDEGQAAVTVPKLKAVYFLETDPHLKVTGYFATECECFGIDKTGDDFVITCDPWSNLPSVRIFSGTGKLLRLFQLGPTGEQIFKCPLHVCMDYFNTVIFVSDSSADCVHMLPLQGIVLRSVEHGLLEYPTGLAVDRNNSLYVCSKSHSNVHVFDGQGVHQRIDVRARDGLTSPRAICFHPYGDFMVLTDLEGSNSTGYLKRYLN